MKKTKKLLSLLLVLLTLGMLMLPAAAETETITEVKARVATPIIGARIDSLKAYSGEPEKYAAKIHKVYYTIKNEAGKIVYCYPRAEDTFVSGVVYSIRVEFTPQKGYKIDYENLTAEIVDRKNAVQVGSTVWELDLRAKTQEYVDNEDAAFALAHPDFGKVPAVKPEADTADLCPYCGEVHDGGFLQKIIGFFHLIFFRLFGAK